MRKFCEELPSWHRRKCGACRVRPRTLSHSFGRQHELFMIILHSPHKFTTYRGKQDICISRMISKHARPGCAGVCPILSGLLALVSRPLRYIIYTLTLRSSRIWNINLMRPPPRWWTGVRRSSVMFGSPLAPARIYLLPDWLSASGRAGSVFRKRRKNISPTALSGGDRDAGGLPSGRAQRRVIGVFGAPDLAARVQSAARSVIPPRNLPASALIPFRHLAPRVQLRTISTRQHVTGSR